jgi:serine acetyltransferase
VVIGKNVIIYHNVTLAGKRGESSSSGAPIIGSNVIIFPNSIIIGRIRVSDYSVISAGSVVINDVPPGAIVAGNPARVVGRIDREGFCRAEENLRL